MLDDFLMETTILLCNSATFKEKHPNHITLEIFPWYMILHYVTLHLKHLKYLILGGKGEKN